MLGEAALATGRTQPQVGLPHVTCEAHFRRLERAQSTHGGRPPHFPGPPRGPFEAAKPPGGVSADGAGRVLVEGRLKASRGPAAATYQPSLSKKIFFSEDEIFPKAPTKGGGSPPMHVAMRPKNAPPKRTQRRPIWGVWCAGRQVGATAHHARKKTFHCPGAAIPAPPGPNWTAW